MKPKGKCIAKKCEECRFYENWDLTNSQTGERKLELRCSFEVLFQELPKLRGSIDGLQGGVNEARNASLVVKENIGGFVQKVIGSLKVIATMTNRLEGNSDRSKISNNN